MTQVEFLPFYATIGFTQYSMFLPQSHFWYDYFVLSGARPEGAPPQLELTGIAGIFATNIVFLNGIPVTEPSTILLSIIAMIGLAVTKFTTKVKNQTGFGC